jgi:hypothetical protein
MAHFTSMQGCGLGTGTVNGHPATAMTLAMVAIGCPLTTTRGCEGAMVAFAMCVHCITAFT